MTTDPQFLPPPVAGAAPTQPIQPEPTVSPLAAELVSKGAEAARVDYDALLLEMQQQLAQQKAQIAALQAEKGIPSDPIEAAIKNLKDHLTARAAQSPLVDFSEPLKLIANLPAETQSVSPTHSELLMTTVHELVDTLKHLDLNYVKSLATSLHKETLKQAAGM